MKRCLTLIFCLVMLFPAVRAAALDEPDLILMEPGDSGYDTATMLKKCAGLGYLKNMPEGEDVYQEAYRDAVMAMEAALGLTADGVIWLSEFVELEDLLYEGCEGSKVRSVLAKLYDLGYLTGLLPEGSNKWEKKHTAGIRKAEKALGLTQDGVLTGSEIKVILGQKVEKPAAVKNLKVKAANGKVNVSWSASKGAAYYEVYRDGLRVATVTGKTSWQDTGVQQGWSYSYRVVACKYMVHSADSTIESVYVEPVYKSIGLKEVVTNRPKYDGAFVKLGTMQYSSYSWSGKNLILSVYVKSGNTYYRARLVLEDYANWTGERIYNYRVKTVNGTGQVTSVGTTTVEITMHSINYQW